MSSFLSVLDFFLEDLAISFRCNLDGLERFPEVPLQFDNFFLNG